MILLSVMTCFWLSFQWKVKVLVAQLCQILCDPMDCSPLGSSVCGILQARILEWVAVSFSRGSEKESSQPMDGTQVSSIAGRFFTVWATREAPKLKKLVQMYQSHKQFLEWKELLRGPFCLDTNLKPGSLVLYLTHALDYLSNFLISQQLV